MNTVQLECFLAVAEALNFAAAADLLGFSQPAVSHQIKSLEAEVGVRLFNRTTRTVELTPAGLTFLEDAKEILTRTKTALLRFQEPEKAPLQVLSIGLSVHHEMAFLPEVLQELSRKHPNLHPWLQTLPLSALLMRVAEGTMDIAFSVRAPETPKKALVYTELYQVPLACVLKEDHALAGKDAILSEDLKDEPLILYHPEALNPELARAQGQISAGRSPSDLYFCASPDLAILLAKAGFGTAILPDLDVPENSGLKKHLLQDLPAVSFGYYTKKEEHAPLLADLIHLVREKTQKKDRA